MKGTHLGEFEEIILLLIGVLQENAYGLALVDAFEQQAGRRVAIGAVHSALSRLAEKGFVVSKMSGATAERGGRRKRIFTITATGKRALVNVRDLRVSLWQQIPDLSLGRLSFDV
jgi:DNA-binding PadR family transcriptional regulator